MPSGWGADESHFQILMPYSEFFSDEPEVSAINRYVIENEDQVQSGEVDDLDFDLVMNVFDLCHRYFPSVPWQLPPRQQPEIAAHHERQARYSTRKFAEATGAKPPDPTIPLTLGTLHEAFADYRKEREREVAVQDSTVDATGHFLLGLVDSLPKAHADIPLNMLDLTRCKEMIDHWRYRPPSERGDKAPLSAKVCRERLRQLDLFFQWLHLTGKYAWRKPVDFAELDRRIRSLPSDKRSIRQLEIPTFSVEELSLIYRNANRFERLLLVCCLNCSFGAAEIGRICWEDLFLHQQHPWKSQGLKVHSTAEDSWCGLLRPKTAVLGWWWLFPETVQLLGWWQGEIRTILGREPKPDDRIILTSEGTSLYRDLSKNAQSGFNNLWTRLLKRANTSLKSDEKQIRPLPFGTLRNQLSDWLGGDETNPVLGSLALAHGVPHKGDDLLYKHYANKPWAALFAAQHRWREHLQPMFDYASECPSRNLRMISTRWFCRCQVNSAWLSLPTRSATHDYPVEHGTTTRSSPTPRRSFPASSQRGLGCSADHGDDDREELPPWCLILGDSLRPVATARENFLITDFSGIVVKRGGQGIEPRVTATGFPHLVCLWLKDHRVQIRSRPTKEQRGGEGTHTAKEDRRGFPHPTEKVCPEADDGEGDRQHASQDADLGATPRIPRHGTIGTTMRAMSHPASPLLSDLQIRYRIPGR